MGRSRPPTRITLRGAALAASLLASHAAAARPQPTADPAAAAPTAPAGKRGLRAHFIKEPIVIDGALSEPAWGTAEPATDFIQTEPDLGRAPSERTEIRVLYDAENLYIGIRAFDSAPSQINARELARDGDFANDDKVEILLDTNHDLRNAYRFAVNPLGTQQDALVTDEGRDINVSWNARWTSEALIDEKGWTAEIAIPLMSLRFRDNPRIWGFNASRRVRRKAEESLWTSWQRSFGLERVSQAGELSGLEQLKRRPVFEIKPYATGGWRNGLGRIGGPGFLFGGFGTMGIEVARIGITPSLTSEFTVNPDFGQIEADQQVVNLSRFPVFFPEKRDFFLENAGVFVFGVQGANQAFFTRRMGLTPAGQPVPINFGAKVAGKTGPFEVGLFQVQSRQIGDQSEGAGVPQEDFTVARVKYDLYDRSYVGVIAGNRQGGPTAYNRIGGVDGQYSVSDYWQLKGFLMGSDTPMVRSSVLSGRVDSRYENDLFRFLTAYEDIGSHFNPEIGFVERTGIRQYFGQAAYKPIPSWLPIVKQFEFETQEEYFQDRAGNLATSQTELTMDTQFRNSSDVLVRPIEYVTDVLPEPFEIRPGIVIPDGRYHFNRPRVSVSSDASRRIVITAGEKWGGFYGGERYETTGTASLRPNAHLRVSLEESYNRVTLPQGRFTTNLLATRTSYNFSRKWLSDLFIQVNTAAQLSSVNARLRYLFRPNSDLYLIYNVATGRGLERPSNQLQLKMTFLYGR
ncbi:MAG: carbohydrate binding family 9 domain-containing protein [Elusimicrobia bacterium]|nr:carbohydrate binding family 9 domain-containing protein [Elusimicrobiota bacterium]